MRDRDADATPDEGREVDSPRSDEGAAELEGLEVEEAEEEEEEEEAEEHGDEPE
jgi:hypothetical protein